MATTSRIVRDTRYLPEKEFANLDGGVTVPRPSARSARGDNGSPAHRIAGFMELRPLTRKDQRLYERIYTDPRMWVELGGVVEQDVEAKLERDASSVEADRYWVLVLVGDDGNAVGTVSIWDHEWGGQSIAEIGWMVLPEHQGHGLASAGVAEALRRADEVARWPALHAFPATTNLPSNALCHKHGFALRGPIEYRYHDRTLRVKHWVRPNARSRRPACRSSYHT